MNELDVVIEECVRRMRAEGYSVEQCLAKYPDQARELRPLLEAAHKLSRARAMEASPAFKARARAKVLQHALEHHRRPGHSWLPARQLAVALTVLVFLVVASTTAFAQGALPGDPLYSWKLTSEQIWWTVSSDRVGVDLSLADRRTTELTKVVDNPVSAAQARDALYEVLDRLEGEATHENAPKIDQALLAHQKKLSQHGIHDKKLDDLVRERGRKK